jgi:hypothetical protein
MQNAFGETFRIDTASRELLQAWFDEWLPLMYPPGADPRLNDPLITSVYPIALPGNVWDWPGDTRFMGESFRIPRDPAQALAALDAQRARIETLIRGAG